MKIRRDVFQAIADPTRREIINLLAHKSLNVNAIADSFSMSRQGISLHIKILEECDLLIIRKLGRERFCEAKLDQLNQVSVWVQQYKRHWEDKLDNLDIYLNKLKKEKQDGKRKK